MKSIATLLRPAVVSLFPSFSAVHHKGQAGKIGVVGGSQNYVGAPYFAAMSALRLGADLATIFCTEAAGVPIKSFSPELMVHPVLRQSGRDLDPRILAGDAEPPVSVDRARVVEYVDSWLSKLSVLVVGPGLGRDEQVLLTARDIIAKAKARNLPLLIDGDGLFLINAQPSLIHGYKRAVLTPNAMEFSRLWSAVFPKEKAVSMAMDQKAIEALPLSTQVGDVLSVSSPLAEGAARLAKGLGGVTIVQKGQVDVISNGDEAVCCWAKGSPRRCGGQGDMLAGLTALLSSWVYEGEGTHRRKGSASSAAEATDSKPVPKDERTQLPKSLLAAFGGCLYTRLCNEAAFASLGRSTLTTDMIAALPSVLRKEEALCGQRGPSSL